MKHLIGHANTLSAVIVILLLSAPVTKPAPANANYRFPGAIPAGLCKQDNSTYTIKDAGLQFEVPEGWNAETDKNESVVVSLDGGAISVTFVVDDDYASVVTGMKQGLAEELTQMRTLGQPRQYTLNGMARTSESGKGLLKGNSINWSIDVLKTRKTVTILTFGVSKVMEQHGEDYAKLVGSLKRI